MVGVKYYWLEAIPGCCQGLTVSLPEYIISKMRCDYATISSLPVHTALMINHIIIKSSLFSKKLRKLDLPVQKDTERVMLCFRFRALLLCAPCTQPSRGTVQIKVSDSRVGMCSF